MVLRPTTGRGRLMGTARVRIGFFYQVPNGYALASTCSSTP